MLKKEKEKKSIGIAKDKYHENLVVIKKLINQTHAKRMYRINYRPCFLS